MLPLPHMLYRIINGQVQFLVLLFLQIYLGKVSGKNQFIENPF